MWIPYGATAAAFNIAELDFRFVCISGLTTSSSPTMLVTSPDGVQHAEQMDEASSNTWSWDLEPGPGLDPAGSVGQYSFEIILPAPAAGGSSSPTPTVTPSLPETPVSPSSAAPTASAVAERQFPAAQDGVVVASGQFTVTRPTERAGQIIGGGLGPGNVLRVSLAGFPPNSLIFLTVYGPGAYGAATFPLFRDLPAVAANANGEALAQWSVPAGTAAGHYGLWLSPAPEYCEPQAACFPFSVGS